MKKLVPLMAVLGAAGVAFTAGSYTDELGESPQYWYAFVRGQRSFGSQDMTFEKGFSAWGDTEREGSNCAAVPGTGGYGKDFAYGSGNWTMLLRARSDDTDNAVIACFGQPMTAGSNIVLASGGAGKITLSGCGGNALHADLITADVADAATVFHTYGIQRSGKKVSLWIDGTKVGEIDRANNPGSNCFHFFNCYGGIGNSGFVASTAEMSTAVSEYRFYTKALSADDMKTAACPPCDELGYRPLLHFTFNGVVEEAPDSMLRATPLTGAESAFTIGRAGAYNTAIVYDGQRKVRGAGLAWAANDAATGGDWSVVVDAKVESTDNAVILYCGAGNAQSSFGLASGGAGKVTLSAYSGNAGHADRLTANIDDAATAFHRYAIVRSGNNMSLWVDGVNIGTIDRGNNPTQNEFSFLSPYGADSANGFVSATQSAIDDFRLYKRALTEAELLALSAAQQDEIGETPVHWLKFDGNLDSCGKVAPNFTSGTDAVAFGPADAEAKTFALGSGSLPQGGDLCWRSGSWTAVIRARSVDTDNAVIAAFGPSAANASACVALTSAGAGRIALSGYSGAANHADLITGTVPTASSEFHTYAIRRVEDIVELWADGEMLGQLTRASNPTVNQFALFTLPGSLGSGFVHDDNVAIDDFRIYERALTELELCAISGVAPITVAWWTGAVDNDLANAANWCCTNSANVQVEGALPRSCTKIHFAGPVGVSIPADASLQYEQVVFENALAADVDLRGLDFSKVSGTLDLAGHNLTLATLGGDATITDTVGGGELHLVVPANATVNGGSLSLAGKLKLVKEGPGTYVAAKAQSYDGGTEIAAGTAKFGVNGDGLPFGASGSAIAVAAGATLDANGKVNEYPYPVTIAGGVLANSGATQSMTVDSFSTVTLTADSTVNLNGNLSIRGQNDAGSTLDLGGYTLTVNTTGDKVFRLSNCQATNGKVVLTGTASTLTLFGAAGNNAATVDFDLAGSMAPYTPSTVRDLTLRNSCLYQTACAATTTVTRVFTPLTTQFQNICLADGATLDVSSYDEVFSLVNTEHDDREIVFAPGARVTVDVHGRELAPGDQLLSWSERPAGVSFQLDAASALHHSVVAQSTGLFVTRGLVVIMR